MKRTRKSFKYRFYHFIYGICLSDFIKINKIVLIFLLDLFTALLGFILIFIVPFFFC